MTAPAEVIAPDEDPPPVCKATTLPCCFGCPATVCELVDVRGAKDNSETPRQVVTRRRRWWWR